MTRKLLIVGAAIAALSVAACGQKSDETKAATFVEKAAASDMFEIEAAKLAAKRSTNAEVKAFAAKMEKAHTKTTEDLKAAIAAWGAALTPPTALPADLQDKLDDLNKADDKDFDKKYADSQVDAHQAALNLLQRYAQDGDTAAIKAFAAATAPAVQEHLNHAEGLKKGFDKAD